MTSEIAPADLAAAPLGHATDHPDAYAPDVLYAIPRAPQRAALGIGDRLPFAGADVWTAYELTCSIARASLVWRSRPSSCLRNPRASSSRSP
jgi:NADPH-dependent 7-cyano-7-deazaguanine reductase QueF-like protein